MNNQKLQHLHSTGIIRRELLQVGFSGLFGLGMVNLGLTASLNTKKPKSVILVFLTGASSHIDMFDMKPDAPVEIRGEFKPISTNVPGIQISEHLPMLAMIANKYDLVVMDPPTFSNSKRMKDVLDIQRDHVILINDMLKAMKPGGILFFSTNYTQFIIDSENIKSKLIKDITKATTPFDFEGRLKRWCYKIEKE